MPEGALYIHDVSNNYSYECYLPFIAIIIIIDTYKNNVIINGCSVNMLRSSEVPPGIFQYARILTRWYRELLELRWTM